jgi:hypothetical protein
MWTIILCAIVGLLIAGPIGAVVGAIVGLALTNKNNGG